MNNLLKRFHGLAMVGLFLAFLPTMQAVELRFLNWDGEDADLKFLNQGKVVPIRAAEGQLSPTYHYEGSGVLGLFKEVTTPEGKIVREPAVQLSLPADATHLIFVLAAKDETARTYESVMVDDSPESRPAGTVRVVNLSRLFVAFKINNTDFMMKPGASHQLAVDGGLQRVLAQAAARVGADKWELVANNPLPVRRGLRVLLVLRDGRPQEGSKTNLVDMLSFYDRPPAPPEKPVAVSMR